MMQEAAQLIQPTMVGGHAASSARGATLEAQATLRAQATLQMRSTLEATAEADAEAMRAATERNIPSRAGKDINVDTGIIRYFVRSDERLKGERELEIKVECAIVVQRAWSKYRLRRFWRNFCDAVVYPRLAAAAAGRRAAVKYGAAVALQSWARGVALREEVRCMGEGATKVQSWIRRYEEKSEYLVYQLVVCNISLILFSM